MKAGFLRRYTSTENVIDMMEQLAIRTGLSAFTDGQKELLKEISDTIEPILERSIDQLEIQLLWHDPKPAHPSYCTTAFHANSLGTEYA